MIYEKIILLGEDELTIQLYSIFREKKNVQVILLHELTDEMKNLIRSGMIDAIYLSEQSQNFNSILEVVSDSCCDVFFINHNPEKTSKNYFINGISITHFYTSKLNGKNRFIKRVEDIILSFLILLLISPILLSIAILIKLTSKGPVLFKQKRYGENGKIINVWKFRSMNVMENDHKVVQATKNDPRLTSIGGFLRKTSLDELPQFFNVLFGDMSIVGPRPHAIAHNEQYRKLIQGYMQRHKIKPGITGLAQISGYRGETDTLKKMKLRVKYDLVYIQNWSLWLDFKIIFLTIFKGFVSKTAY